MVEFKAQIDGLTCESCRTLITKAVNKATSGKGRLASLDLQTGAATLDIALEDLPATAKAISEKGYSITIDGQTIEARVPGEQSKVSAWGSMARVLGGVWRNEAGYKAERELAETGILTAVLLAGLNVALSFTTLAGVSIATSTRLPFIPFLVLIGVSSAAVSGAFYHVRAYRKHFACMTGMMLGMGVGMIAGFLFGAFVGATNGMFVGAVFGVAIGAALGAVVGNCCGVMGVLEGLMAGLMSGTMGAMLSVMLWADNLYAFLILLTVFCIVLLAGLSFMVVKQTQPAQLQAALPSTARILAFALVLNFLTLLLVTLGPKSALAAAALG